MTTFSLSAQKKLLTRRRSGWIGIDIGADALKLAQVERAGTEWKISGSLILPTGDGRLSAGNLTSNGWIAELVQSALMGRLCISRTTGGLPAFHVGGRPADVGASHRFRE